MNKLKIVNNYFFENDIISLSADGFDDAILGVCGEVIAYSVTKCIDILMTRDNMSMEEAVEYFNFNVRDTYVGDKTPLYVDDRLFH